MNAKPEFSPAPRIPHQNDVTYPHPAEDEISLIDMWLVLVRRKWILAAVMVTATLGGLAYALFLPPKYAYSTTIEIGSQIQNNQATPIEAPDSVRAKIAESYIPLVLHERQQGMLDERKRYEIKVDVPKNSQVIVLRSEGREQDEDTYTALHRAVVERIQDDHKRVSNVLRRNLEALVADRERKIAGFQEDGQMLAAQLKRLADERDLITKEIEQTEQLIAAAGRNHERAIREAADGPGAVTLMLITDELRNNRSRLTELKQRVLVELPNRHDQLEKSLSDVRRSQEEEKAQIESLRLSLQGLLETRAVTPPIRLLEPIGPGRGVIVILSVLLGLMFGIFAALFSEFLSKARAHAGSTA